MHSGALGSGVFRRNGAILSLALGFAVGVPSCSRSSAQGAQDDSSGGPGEASVVPTAAAEAQAGGAEIPPASDRFDEAGFSLKVSPQGEYRSGQAGAVEVLLLAKDPYHVNDEYPTKLKLEAVPGVRFPAPVVGKDVLEIAGQRGKMLVKFTPERAGQHRIGGRLAFSVCNDDRCLVLRRDLALTIRAQ